jgi:hypothetical protein
VSNGERQGQRYGYLFHGNLPFFIAVEIASSGQGLPWSPSRFGAFFRRLDICGKYEESRSPGREWEQPVPGLLPVQQPTPWQLRGSGYRRIGDREVTRIGKLED